jgi:predicted nuclease of predicted toxin-antitoxin system
VPIKQPREIQTEFPPLDKRARMETLSEWRNAKRTRFVADENLEPWALYVMRYKNFDIMSADQAGIRRCDDRQVFGRAWQLKRVLVTHDADFLSDAAFPLRSSAGLLVVPQYGAVSLEFGNLLSAAASLISRGQSMWFHTKIEATRQFVLKVRTWDKDEGLITRWNFAIPARAALRAASRRS